MEDFIQLKESNVIRVGIKDKDGNILDGELEFDLEDIELPIKYQEMLEKHKKNDNDLRHQLNIINKKEDIKGKKLFSKNQEETFKAIKEYYLKEIEALDYFLGEGKTQMLLNAMKRKPYMSMFEDIGELLTPLIPIFEKNLEITEKTIKEKYKIKEDNILK